NQRLRTREQLSRVRLIDLGQAALDDLRHEGLRERPLRGEVEGALAQVVALELVLVGAHPLAAEAVQRQMVLPVAVVDEALALVLEADDAVADAFGRLRRGGLDRLAQFLQCGALIRSRAREVVVDGRRMRGLRRWL